MRLREQKGLSLIEVLIGLSILGVVIIALLAGLITAVLGVGQVDQRTMALNLARSQIEYVKSEPYEDPANTIEELRALYTIISDIPDSDIPEGYSITGIVSKIEAGVLQQIAVTVTYGDGKSVQLDGYRTNR